MTDTRNPTAGAFWAMAAVTFFAMNDAAVKFLSDGYALHQVILLRSLVGLTIMTVVILPFAGGPRILRTRKLKAHLLRGLFIVFANMAFFLGIASMPLAEAVAIFFVAPLLTTVYSAIFLKEKVGPWRIGAIGVGLIGVLIIVRPGSDAFQAAALLPIVAANFYALIHIMTRRLGGTESAVTMSIIMQVVFIGVCLAIGSIIGWGQFDTFDNPALSFLFRAWSWPQGTDLWVFLLIGVGIAGAATMISQAYKVSEATLVAPFEYIALPMSVFYGIVLFDEWPDAAAIAGSALIVAGGLVLIYREARVGKSLAKTVSR